MQTRLMTQADIMTVAQLDDEYYPVEGGWSAKTFAEELAKPDNYFIVVEDEGKIVAYAGAGYEGDMGELTVNTVTTPYRRTGLGRKLLEMRLDWLDAKGVKDTYLQTRTDNRPLISLVSQYGFKVSTLIQDYYPEGVNALEMVRIKAQSL